MAGAKQQHVGSAGNARHGLPAFRKAFHGPGARLHLERRAHLAMLGRRITSWPSSSVAPAAFSVRTSRCQSCYPHHAHQYHHALALSVERRLG
jgi:hypothetical protein